MELRPEAVALALIEAGRQLGQLEVDLLALRDDPEQEAELLEVALFQRGFAAGHDWCVTCQQRVVSHLQFTKLPQGKGEAPPSRFGPLDPLSS